MNTRLLPKHNHHVVFDEDIQSETVIGCSCWADSTDPKSCQEEDDEYEPRTVVGIADCREHCIGFCSCGAADKDNPYCDITGEVSWLLIGKRITN